MPDLSPSETRALNALDTAAMVADLVELVSIPSITGTDAEADAQAWVAGRLGRLGLDVDHWEMDVPALERTAGYPGREAERSQAWGVVGSTPADSSAGSAQAGPTLILQGHVDVVPPGDLDRWPGRDPFSPRIDGGVLHARGACDMKAGVVATIAAVRAVLAAGSELQGRVAIHSVISEEDGGLGAFGTLLRGHTGDACVIPEPTSGTVITANGGALTFGLSVPGQATHGSTPYAGHSAIDAYLPLHAVLAELERERNARVDPLMAEYPVAYPISVGILSAGDWASSVPDLLTAQGRLGIAIGEDPADARAALTERVADVCARDPWLRDHPVTVSWPGGQFASGRLPAGDPLLGLVQDAVADVGGTRPRERGAPYGSDSRLYNGAGIPTLHLGPGEVRHAHSPDEQVALAEVGAVAAALVLVILRTAGSGPGA
jgi:acetylornithine deacetylase